MEEVEGKAENGITVVDIGIVILDGATTVTLPSHTTMEIGIGAIPAINLIINKANLSMIIVLHFCQHLRNTLPINFQSFASNVTSLDTPPQVVLIEEIMHTLLKMQQPLNLLLIQIPPTGVLIPVRPTI